MIEPVHDVDEHNDDDRDDQPGDQRTNQEPDIFPTSPMDRPSGRPGIYETERRPMALKLLTCSVSARSTGRRSIDDAP